jgi:uncharacterized membrane protein
MLIRTLIESSLMSAEDDDEASLVHMVTAPYRSRADGEMTIIGLLYGVGLVFVMLPLLPFILVLWAFSAITDAATADSGH